MSARDWKPGDVAMYDGANPGVLLRTVSGWVDTDGDYRDPPTAGLRPLAVIDHEDREQVERLANAIWAYPGNLLNNFCSAVEQGLREFTNPTPPRPEEPMSALAIVEDRDGKQWYRMPLKRTPDRLWAALDDGGYDRDYADIDAVRILSPGVTP